MLPRQRRFLTMRALFMSSVLSIITTLAQIPLSTATPFPVEYDGPLLNPRCDNGCGWYKTLCCGPNQSCGTNSEGQAICVDPESAGSENGVGSSGWQYYTTIYTSTDLQTVTSVWSSYITPAPSNNAQCDQSIGQSVCGTSCCGADEVCSNGVCVAGSSSGAVVPATTTGGSETATPPLRPTSSGAATVTESASTTVPFIAPIGTNGATVVVQASSSGGGLSGGAIAGIVIGVIFAVILLILILICICAREMFDGLLALLGLGPRRKQETTYVEERYSHHSGGRPERRTWFGARPARPPPSTSEKKRSGVGFWATILLIGGAIALCLGLRRRNDRDDGTDSGYDYYTYYSDEYTSASKFGHSITFETEYTHWINADS